jgi:uncharacterized repeat protein (TIGR01451 family)
VLSVGSTRKLKSLIGLSIGVVGLMIATASSADAHVDPLGCTTSGINLQFAPSSGLGTIHRNGDHLDIGVRVSNNAAGSCSVDNATVTVAPPNPDGTAGAPITVASGVSFPGGMAQTTLPTTAPFDEAFNAGVFKGPVTVAISGTAHYPGGDITGFIGSLGTNTRVSKPQISLSVTPTPASGPAPFNTTYTYSATNNSPPDPDGPVASPTPALQTPAADTAILSDDTCSPLLFTGGDTHVTTPPLLEQGETWTFTCTHLFPGPGTFTDHVSVVGISTRDGRDWPTTTAQSSVTANGIDMTVSATHAGSFVRGDTGKTYELTARNSGNQPTSSAVTLTDQLPNGLTATAISGNGWNCDLATLTCTRSDPLAGGADYPPVTVTVDVATDAADQVVNGATVAGGGETLTANDSASDSTDIGSASNDFDLGATKSNRDGSVSVKVDVPGAGTVSADDASEFKSVAALKASGKATNLVKATHRDANAAGTVVLQLKPTAAAKKLLKHKRAVKAKITVQFEPTGGDAATHPDTIKFKRPKH